MCYDYDEGNPLLTDQLTDRQTEQLTDRSSDGQMDIYPLMTACKPAGCMGGQEEMKVHCEHYWVID